MDPWQRFGSRSRLHRRHAGDGRNERGARLRLPPGIDHGTAAVADDLPIPFPGLRVDRLANGADQAQRLARVPGDPLVTLALQRTDGGWGGIENGHAQPVDRFPEAPKIWVVGD